MDPTVPALPAPLRWAVRLLFVEAAMVTLVAAFLGYESATAEVGNTGRALAVTGYAVAVAALFALLGVQLSRRRAWARGLAIATQLALLLPVAYYLTRGGLGWLGVPVGVLALTVAGLLVAPATREALGIR